MACAASLLAVQSFAQPRDLFAEFEEEATAADKAAAVADSTETAKAAADKAAAEKQAAEEKAAADKGAAEKQAAEEKAAADKAAAEKQAAEEKVAADKAAAEKQTAEEKAASDKATADSIAAAQAYQRAADEKMANMARATAAGAALEAEKAQAAADSSGNQDPYEGMDRNEMYAREMQRISDSLLYISDSIAVAQMEADSIAAVEKAKQDSIQAHADSIKAASASSVAIASSSSMSRRDILGPVKVSKVNGLDDMKGKYKSPRKAMFMSLVIPGSGQLYVGGSNFTYVRGGVYLALEAALWSSWYYYSVSKYNKQVKRYKDFAKEHYSIGKYERGMRDLYDADAEHYASEFRSRYFGSRESFCEAIFGDATKNGCYDKTNLFYGDKLYYNEFVQDPKSLGEEMKKFKFEDGNVVFQQIADNAYVLGWDDVTDQAVANNLGLEDPNSETVVLGTSENRDAYRSMRGKANDYADMQAWFFGGIILNHIISAVDAAFTAHSHNKALYQEDLSWYDRLHFDGGLLWGEHVGVNVNAGWSF